MFIILNFSLSTQDDSATVNTDYQQATEIVTFQPGDILKDVGFTIIDDQRIEESESFKVVLTAVSNQVTIGSVREHTIEIVDDDCKCGTIVWPKHYKLISQAY